MFDGAVVVDVITVEFEVELIVELVTKFLVNVEFVKFVEFKIDVLVVLEMELWRLV